MSNSPACHRVRRDNEMPSLRETTLRPIFTETRSLIRPQQARFLEISHPARLKQSVVAQLLHLIIRQVN